MKINYKIVAEHLGVPLRGNETFTELLEIEKQVKDIPLEKIWFKIVPSATKPKFPKSVLEFVIEQVEPPER